MSRNGSGVYSLPGTYEAVSGQTIEAQQHNDPLEDLESDANAARPIVAGGTGAVSAADARNALGVTAAIAAAIEGLLESGTIALFQQTSAPTGWTKKTDHNNKALRIVSGTASSGGTTSFTSVFTSRTIAQANLPNVNFTVTGTGTLSDNNFVRRITPGSVQVANGSNFNVTPFEYTNEVSPTVVALSAAASSGGSGTALDFAVQYVDVIAAERD